MKKGILIASLLMLATTTVFSQKNTAVTPVIFDTDMGPDYDDVGAIAILHAMADSGKINVLATISSTRYEGVAAVLSVFNTYFKRPEIPEGVPDDLAIDQRDSQHWTDSLIRRYPHAIKENRQAENALKLYRRLLAGAADSSVVILTVGFLTNISALLSSPPDNLSPLNGAELVKKKVARLVSMAGRFPEGKEFNIYRDAPAAKFAFAHFPRPVIFCGFELGDQIKSGLPLVRDEKIGNSPVKDAFSICIPLSPEDSDGRKSWDELTTLIAITGPGDRFGLEPGSIVVDDDGSNRWNSGGNGSYYLKAIAPIALSGDLINSLMRHQPK